MQFSSVAQSCPTLCNPTKCSMPEFPVHYQLPELAQTYVYWVSDAIQPSHPLLSPSPPAFNLSQHQVFSNESALCIRWPKHWSFSIIPSNEYSGLISFRIDWWAIIFELRECVKNPASDWRASAGAGIEPLVLSTSSSAQGDKWHRVWSSQNEVGEGKRTTG